MPSVNVYRNEIAADFDRAGCDLKLLIQLPGLAHAPEHERETLRARLVKSIGPAVAELPEVQAVLRLRQALADVQEELDQLAADLAAAEQNRLDALAEGGEALDAVEARLGRMTGRRETLTWRSESVEKLLAERCTAAATVVLAQVHLAVKEADAELRNRRKVAVLEIEAAVAIAAHNLAATEAGIAGARHVVAWFEQGLLHGDAVAAVNGLLGRLGILDGDTQAPAAGPVQDLADLILERGVAVDFDRRPVLADAT